MDGKKKKANPPREPTANISVLSSKLILAYVSFEGVFLELLSNIRFYFNSIRKKSVLLRAITDILLKGNSIDD